MCAALSGYGNVATPASLRMRSPVATSLPPIQLARMGLLGVGRVGDELLRGLRRVGHGLRREDDEEAVAVGVVRQDVEGRGVAVGRRVADDVDGVGVAPGRRQDRC